MQNFMFYNPTKYYFGKGEITQLKNEIRDYEKVLLVYGGGSIKEFGLYDEVVSILNNENKEVFELSGIEPNPRLTSVKQGINLVRNNLIDMVLAVGGGSTIDCAKAIVVSAYTDDDIYDILNYKVKPKKGLGLGTILTLSATGSEMNPRSVISDLDLNLKLGIGDWTSDATFPDFSICDPTYTLTVPKNQTINGIVDIISHVLEQYLTITENSILGDQFAESILKTMIDIGPKLINDLSNYQLRETMMISGTLAWNGLLRGLLNKGEWAAHAIEHALSAVYDIPHGEGLAIIFPVYMEYIAKKDPSRLVLFAKNVWNVNTDNKTDNEIALEGINKFRQFLKNIGAPSTMKYYGIQDYNLEDIIEKTLLGKKTIGRQFPLEDKDIRDLLKKVY
jgi:alcohol dehydrogenase